MAHLPPRSALHGDGRTEHQAQRVDKDVAPSCPYWAQVILSSAVSQRSKR
jgi:hypothetical protein